MEASKRRRRQRRRAATRTRKANNKKQRTATRPTAAAAAELACFGERHFSAAKLGDARRTRRLVKTANLLMQNPSGSLPQRLKDWGELMGLYRLVRCPQVTHEAVLAPHRQRTLEAMCGPQAPPVVLIVHDTTELDYSGHGAIQQQLGPIGNGSRRGYLCHNSLAITPQRQVLGLLSQKLHLRRQVPAGETPLQKRLHPQRESRLWLWGCEAAIAEARPPEGRLWVDIADRGADTFEFLAYEQQHRRHYIVRSAKDRKLAGEEHLGCDRVHQTLHGYVRDLPVLGERLVQVHANQGRSKRQERTARVAVSAGPVTIRMPAFVRGECPPPQGEQQGLLSLWAICVREIPEPASPVPAGEEPLEWVLLTNLPAQTMEQAGRLIDWYCCRIVVEELHRGMKSGGGEVEALQFEQPERLEPLIALLSVVAAMLLDLRQWAQDPQAQRTAARERLPLLYVQVLSGWREGQVREDLTVREFCLALGKLGGHLNRKRDGFPGWLTMWRGWRELQSMVRGAEAIGRKRCV